jgi:ABC-type branched-subunit amino acid transport system permease subunit
VASFYSLAVLFIAFLLLRRMVHSPLGRRCRRCATTGCALAAIGMSVNGRLAAVYTLSAGAGRRGRARCWRRPPASRRWTCSSSTAAPT